ncbi:DUF262 domain-containing protein [Hujiaoplasma nucleasis]|uniref:DUF262 domain-containing protein n=1 Tax=Hujiaoplasma nucleasis TaxID=2725268 RepID=A0A7L6N2N0_9MOLU|nr:DUF262 domain-containing protein [Hujiaoplasma nucleasis]QLY39811.1 DUF262 domain-containing protein [Hujiaoplasma nucleasis]
MSFKTETRSISEVFQRSSRYIIPRYQRSYVWQKNNWSELLSDIRFTMINQHDLWSHFLGAIVLSTETSKKQSEKISGIDDYEIIDGQQRITTVYLLLATIKSLFMEMQTDKSLKRADYINNTFITSLSTDSEKVIMIDNDELDRDIKEILDKTTEINRVKKSNKLYNLVNYLYLELKNYDLNKLDAFLERLLDIKIVEIVSNQEEEIYNIFEVLNARGQKLKQIELLKNHLMKYIQPRDDKFIDEAKDKWNSIILNSNHLNNVDDMINHFAKCYIEKSAENSNSVYKLIKNEIPLEKLSNLLDDLLRFSTAYKNISPKQHSSLVIEYFDIKRNQQIRSLLTSIELKRLDGVIDNDVFEKTIKNLRNFVFIFNVTQQTSNRIDKIVSEFAYRIYYSNCINDYLFNMTQFFIRVSEYVDEDNFTKNFPMNPSLRYSNKESRLKRNSRLVKYVLLNYLQKEQKDSSLDSTNLTIEHLISDDGDTDNATIKNLTLTTQVINEKLANKDINEKVLILESDSSIVLNKTLKNYIKNGMFGLEKRQEEIISAIWNDIFNFTATPFNISKENVTRYFELDDLLRDEEDLLNHLKDRGKHFEISLQRDPKLYEMKEKFNAILDAN